jgi:threonylcarbamoyladenosine tRNA methylthiotransferase MtaB
MISVKIDTHGCKLNQADSIQLQKKFTENGYYVDSEVLNPDIYILNSCTVTHVADKKARQALRKYKKENPNSLVVLTGCYAQRDKENLIKTKIADLIFDNTEKNDIVKNLSFHLDYQVPEITQDKIMPGTLIDRTRASVKIQEGCNQICAYCIVPKVRGREISIDKNIIVKEINYLHESGFKEIILTGTQLGTYGYETGKENLSKLIQYILDNTKIDRLRISSIQAHEITLELLKIYKENSNRICNHFHLSLQSGSDKILKSMRRKYTQSEFMQSVNLIRANLVNPSISTDVIIGFPDESEDDFKETIKVINHSDFSKIHLFPYSDRPGTSSFYFKDKINAQIKNSRMKFSLELVKNIEYEYRNKMLNQNRNVLWEKSNRNDTETYFGYTEDYLKVMIKSSEKLFNTITNVKLKEIKNELILVTQSII